RWAEGAVGRGGESRVPETDHEEHRHGQKDDGKLRAEQVLERLGRGCRAHQVLSQGLQHRLERNEIGRLVVEQEEADRLVSGGGTGHGRRPGQRYSHTRSSERSWSMSTGLAM